MGRHARRIGRGVAGSLPAAPKGTPAVDRAGAEAGNHAGGSLRGPGARSPGSGTQDRGMAGGQARSRSGGERTTGFSIHVSAGTPESSIGRWQTEMPAELAKRFSDELGDELKALGFDVPGPRPSPRQPVADAAQASRQKPPPRPDAAVEVVGNGQRKPGEATHEDVARLRAALQSAAIEKARLQRGLHETEHWLRQLEHSRSWRVTRPFRAAGAAFRKLSLRRAAPPRRRV